jgi:hypothetical protein
MTKRGVGFHPRSDLPPHARVERAVAESPVGGGFDLGGGEHEGAHRDMGARGPQEKRDQEKLGDLMTADSWHSYPKVWNLGHPNIAELFADPVIIEEKVDGSQFSFGVLGGALRVKSHNKELVADADNGMFNAAVATAWALAPELHDGWTYRAEYLQKPHHNGLAYNRIPNRHLIVFDVNTGPEAYLRYPEKAAEAERIGLEVVPLVFEGVVESAEMLAALIDRESILGGQKVEGVVAKNYLRFARDGKALMGKHVSPQFREVQKGEWRKANPTRGDVIDVVCERLRGPARWSKAIQHLRENGALTNSPKDIGALLKETQADIKAECEDEIKAALFAWAWPQIARRTIAGLPDWYKQLLVDAQFGGGEP